MNNKIKIILIALAAILLIASAICFFAIPRTAAVPTDSAVTDTQDLTEGPTTTHYTEAQLRKIVNKIAKERFGEDAFVIFLSTEGPSEVVIDGIKRKVYIYAADSASAREESGNVRGLYHADADTGEVFDNGNGTMEKVNIGE